MLKPIFPYVYYYLNKDYITSELCENKDNPKLECEGKCHLKKTIKKAIPDNSSNDSNIPINKQIERNYYISFDKVQNVFKILIKPNYIIKKLYTFQVKTYLLEIPNPPPENILLWTEVF